MKETGAIDFTQDFFGKRVYLSVSSQLHLEATILGTKVLRTVSGTTATNHKRCCAARRLLHDHRVPRRAFSRSAASGRIPHA